MFGPMITQRVTKNLGLNRSADKERIYRYIETKLGIKKKLCSRGTAGRKSKYGFSHVGENPLPIRNFSLQYAYIDSKGRAQVKKDGLQTYCLKCERAYRRGRLNKWYAVYSKMTDKEVYANYKRNYGSTAHCSRCGKDKKPEDFSISRRMDKGLHNVCMECSRSYSEAVGNRWIIYSPDGRNDVSLKNGQCKICGSKKSPHKDHIWPLSKGGSDFKENIQILCNKHNLSKSDSIVGISSLHQMRKEMLSHRYHSLFKKALTKNWSVSKFESEISKEVRKLLLKKKGMTDNELQAFFQNEKVRNNRKHSIERAVRKFRNFQDTAILDTTAHIAATSSK